LWLHFHTTAETDELSTVEPERQPSAKHFHK
jgi:hypothetical protein